MLASSRSEPKQKVIDFVKSTKVDPNNTALSLFQFAIHGTEEDAKRFVHRMRVELSRLRELVRQQNREPREFKMLVSRYTYERGVHQTTITLQRTEGRSEIVDPEIAAIFDDIADWTLET